VSKTKERSINEPDFIKSPKYSNSLKKLLDVYPDGVDDKVAMKYLELTKEEYTEVFSSAILKLRTALGANDKI
jgi:hypothetical protein